MANGSDSLLEAGGQYSVVTYSVTKTNSQFGHLKSPEQFGTQKRSDQVGGETPGECCQAGGLLALRAPESPVLGRPCGPRPGTCPSGGIWAGTVLCPGSGAQAGVPAAGWAGCL